MPVNFSQSGIRFNSTLLSWSPPEQSYGIISSYLVTYRKENEGMVSGYV